MLTRSADVRSKRVKNSYSKFNKEDYVTSTKDYTTAVQSTKRAEQFKKASNNYRAVLRFQWFVSRPSNTCKKCGKQIIKCHLDHVSQHLLNEKQLHRYSCTACEYKSPMSGNVACHATKKHGDNSLVLDETRRIYAELNAMTKQCYGTELIPKAQLLDCCSKVCEKKRLAQQAFEHVASQESPEVEDTMEVDNAQENEADESEDEEEMLSDNENNDENDVENHQLGERHEVPPTPELLTAKQEEPASQSMPANFEGIPRDHAMRAQNFAPSDGIETFQFSNINRMNEPMARTTGNHVFQEMVEPVPAAHFPPNPVPENLIPTAPINVLIQPPAIPQPLHNFAPLPSQFSPNASNGFAVPSMGNAMNPQPPIFGNVPQNSGLYGQQPIINGYLPNMGTNLQNPGMYGQQPHPSNIPNLFNIPDYVEFLRQQPQQQQFIQNPSPWAGQQLYNPPYVPQPPMNNFYGQHFNRECQNQLANNKGLGVGTGMKPENLPITTPPPDLDVIFYEPEDSKENSKFFYEHRVVKTMSSKQLINSIKIVGAKLGMTEEQLEPIVTTFKEYQIDGIALCNGDKNLAKLYAECNIQYGSKVKINQILKKMSCPHL